jgi:transcriptional regulator with XRE-family HTH domain
MKTLRAAKRSTQEALAAHCGITTQAVSKWERGEGYPDITLLPSIASFYDVSVDELLGVGEIRKQERIAEIKRIDEEVGIYGATPESRDLIRAAYRDYPNDYELMNMYTAIFDPDRTLDETIALSERLLDSPEHRVSAIQRLVYAWIDKGDREKAKEYARMAPYSIVNYMNLMMAILEGEERRVQAQAGLWGFLVLDAWLMFSYIINSSDFTKEEEIRSWEVLTDFSAAIFADDGGVGDNFNLLSVHMRVAYLCAELHDTEKMLTHIKKARDYALAADAGIGGVYKSPLMRGREYSRGKVNYLDGVEHEAEFVLRVLNPLQNSVYDFARDTEEFRQLTVDN